MRDNPAYINRILGSIYNDLGFLVDCGVITEAIYEEVISKIPRRYFPSQNYSERKEVSCSQNVIQNNQHLYPQREENSKVLCSRTSIGSNVAEITSKFQQNVNVATISSPPQVKQAQENNHIARAPLPSVPKKANVTGIFQAEALYDYEGEDDDDLTLKVGDKINVLEYVNEDWWRGICNGKEGIFPANHVKKIQPFTVNERVTLSHLSSQEHGSQKEQNYSQKGYYGYQQPSQPQTQQYNPEKKAISNVGKKFGNAAVFGAGAAVGSHIVGSIL